jgi:hypothetical protein
VQSVENVPADVAFVVYDYDNAEGSDTDESGKPCSAERYGEPEQREKEKCPS